MQNLPSTFCLFFCGSSGGLQAMFLVQDLGPAGTSEILQLKYMKW